MYPSSILGGSTTLMKLLMKTETLSYYTFLILIIVLLIVALSYVKTVKINTEPIQTYEIVYKGNKPLLQ